MSLSPELILVLAMLGLGKLLAITRRMPENTSEVLNTLVIWVLLPALVIRSVAGLSFHAELLVLILTPWLLAAINAALVLVLARVFNWSRALVGCLLLCVALGNTAFIGYPLIEATLGAQAVPYAVVYDQLGTFALLPTFGLAIVAIYSGGERPTATEIARRILLFPAFVALIVGLLPVAHPLWLDILISSLADLLVPLAIFAVGFQLKLIPAPGSALPVSIGLAIKMLLSPLIAFGIAHAVSADPMITAVNTLESAMPTMITAGALAISARMAPDVASALVGYGVLIAVFWVPFLGSFFS